MFRMSFNYEIVIAVDTKLLIYYDRHWNNVIKELPNELALKKRGKIPKGQSRETLGTQDTIRRKTILKHNTICFRHIDLDYYNKICSILVLAKDGRKIPILPLYKRLGSNQQRYPPISLICVIRFRNMLLSLVYWHMRMHMTSFIKTIRYWVDRMWWWCLRNLEEFQ